MEVRKEQYLERIKMEYTIKATQIKNPINKRDYLDQDFLRYILHSKYVKIPKTNIKIFLTEELPKISNVAINPSLNDLIDYQLSLARMEVRDENLSFADYRKTRENCKTLLYKSQKENILLNIIKTAPELDYHLSKLEKKKI